MKAPFKKPLRQMSCACLLMMTCCTAFAMESGSAAQAGGTIDAAKQSGAQSGTTVTGTIIHIDPDNATITVTPTGGKAVSVLTLTTSTVLVGHETISGSAIALGDTLEVSGIPLVIQVTSIADNRVKSSVSAGIPTLPSTVPTSPASTVTGSSTGSIEVKGVVTSLQPAIIKVSDTLSLTLSVSTHTTLSDMVTITASQIAVGDTVSAQVSSSSGTLTATKLDVTAPAS